MQQILRRKTNLHHTRANLFLYSTDFLIEDSAKFLAYIRKKID